MIPYYNVVKPLIFLIWIVISTHFLPSNLINQIIPLRSDKISADQAPYFGTGTVTTVQKAWSFIVGMARTVVPYHCTIGTVGTVVLFPNAVTASGQGMAEATIGVGRVMSTYYTSKPSIESINIFYHASECRLGAFCT